MTHEELIRFLKETAEHQQQEIREMGAIVRLLESQSCGGAEADYARFHELEARLTEKAAQS